MIFGYRTAQGIFSQWGASRLSLAGQLSLWERELICSTPLLLQKLPKLPLPTPTPPPPPSSPSPISLPRQEIWPLAPTLANPNSPLQMILDRVLPLLSSDSLIDSQWCQTLTCQFMCMIYLTKDLVHTRWHWLILIFLLSCKRWLSSLESREFI